MMKMKFGRWEAGGVETEQASSWGRVKDTKIRRRKALGSSSMVSDAWGGGLMFDPDEGVE